MDNEATGASRSWDTQRAAWSLLNGLRPVSLDLDRIGLINCYEIERLQLPGGIEGLMLELGLNDEGLEEFPPYMHAVCGFGLRIWQYPCQFAPYLRHLSQLGVRSYLEIGVRHGGSFVLTTEVLSRFSSLDWAVGVDLIACPSLDRYTQLNPRASFTRANTQSLAFRDLVARLEPVDLVFIDSHHEEGQCRREFEALRSAASIVALHDIANIRCPGVRIVWEEIKSAGEHECFEYTEQYDGLGPFMGIGLAIRKDRPVKTPETAR